jgi:hypothetical protein
MCSSARASHALNRVLENGGCVFSGMVSLESICSSETESGMVIGFLRVPSSAYVQC